MEQTERTRLLGQIADSIGDDAFNRLVGSVKDVRLFRRLRFWQEELLRQANMPVLTDVEFLDLFEGAALKRTGRSQNALTAATTSFLAPLLKGHNFRKYTRRSFGRVTNDCVFQFIDLQPSVHGGETFAVNYASILITRLHEHVGSTTFRRLPRGESGDGWWSAKFHSHADESMREICEKIRNLAIPWFDSTSTPQGLTQELIGLKVHGNPHTFFELGCCQATCGELVKARTSLQEAVHRFQRSYDEMPQRTWALKERLLAEQLIEAIAKGEHAKLLSAWRDQTIINLKLEKILG